MVKTGKRQVKHGNMETAYKQYHRFFKQAAHKAAKEQGIDVRKVQFSRDAVFSLKLVHEAIIKRAFKQTRNLANDRNLKRLDEKLLHEFYNGQRTLSLEARTENINRNLKNINEVKEMNRILRKQKRKEKKASKKEKKKRKESNGTAENETADEPEEDNSEQNENDMEVDDEKSPENKISDNEYDE